MTIEERLCELERENRRWRSLSFLLVLVSIVGLVAGASWWQQQPGPEENIVRANRIEVVDATGKVRFAIGEEFGRIGGKRISSGFHVEARDARINLYNEKGKLCLWLVAQDDGGGIVISDNKEKIKAQVAGDEDGGMIRLWGEKNLTWSAP